VAQPSQPGDVAEQVHVPIVADPVAGAVAMAAELALADHLT